jgi:AFG3 family protein
MDEEAKRLVDVAYKRTLALLQSKKNEIDNLAEMLLEKETITHDDIVMAIGNRPFTPDPMYEEFIKQRVNQQEQDATAATAAGKEDTTVEQQSATDGSSSSTTPPLGIV